MRSFAQLLLIICVAVALTGASRVEAQEVEASYELEFENAFGQSEATFDRRVRWLRSLGWSLLGLGSVAFVVTPFVEVDDVGREVVAIGGWTTASGLAVIGSMLLLGSLIKVGRRRRFRRRFRERQAALDRSYFHPEVDIGITPGGLSLHLSF